ncbi:MAG: ABC transporter permease subunit [Gammaproteobacteria bacterium]|nr:ABC transporter permease [Gammaproteobacteria bacterium]NIV49685.1 ABC transporter permease subunit [Gammaproteobacteria bacterium]NIW57083.1 ABC transporter permease subunit [Gammaproteobacteria bacterium]
MDFTLLVLGDGGWGDEMLLGALMTMAVAVCSYLLGIVIGTLFASLKLSGFAVFRYVADFYTTVIRGIPELLVIYLVFFGGGTLLRKIASGVFGYEGYIDPPLFVTGMVCIGLSAGAYNTEVIRGAVLAVPVGQIEAAKAIGMSRAKRFWRILVPQVSRYALPGLGNVWQLTLKETSLISVIGLVEIMRSAAVASGSTKEPFTFYLVAALLYLGLTSISNRGFLRAEAWASKGVRYS